MSTRELYDQWSGSYDSVENKTRDLEKLAARQVLAGIAMDNVIELGCGTGKNTEWLAQQASHVTAVDFSGEMLAKAKQKITANNVVFQQVDLLQPWTFTDRKADLVTCSLVLEHMPDLLPVFQQVQQHLKDKGHFYLCELHPFKQYSGSKARFETKEGTTVLECYTHHISDYLQTAVAANLALAGIEEWFDDDEKTGIPRLISFLFRKR
jgi:ubiquinone/menaquinone biosynthesis C-methylase UbiE